MNQKIYTDLDFALISWHDNYIHSIELPNLKNIFKLNIDFIIEWKNVSNKENYDFIVAPAILCFYNVFNLEIDIKLGQYTEVYIDQITRDNNRLSPNNKTTIWDYHIITDCGRINFTATGFKQTLTNVAIQSSNQKYPEAVRSFPHS